MMSPARRRRLRAVRRGLGSEELDCLAEANEATAALDAIINTEAKLWKPTGLFEPAQLKEVVDSVVALIDSARAAVMAAPDITSDAQSQKNQALADLARKYMDASRFYFAIAKATGEHSLVRADDIKDFVLRGSNAASNALATAAVLQCRLNSMVGFLISFQGQYELVAFSMRRTAGVIADIARKIVTVAKGAASVVDALIKVGLFAGAAWIGWSIYKEMKR